MMTSRAITRWLRLDKPAFRGGLCVIVVGVVLVLLALKTDIVSAFRGGTTIQAEFSIDYNLRNDRTKVKVAGLPVGVVTGIEHTGRGTTIAKMKVDEDVLRDLGPKPLAQIDPLTILGGNVSVNLVPGGGRGTYDGSPIPLKRTSVPTELDHILDALPEDSRTAMQGTVENTTQALQAGGADSLRKLAKSTRQPFGDAGRVFTAVNGGARSADLARLVAEAHNLSRTLSTRTGEIDASVGDLQQVLAVLSRERGAVGTTIDELPQALERSQAGMDDLRGSLARLGTTSSRLRPMAEAAGPLVRSLGPALEELRPLLADLKPTLHDARPLVAELIPVVDRTSVAVGDLRGPVLERVNGPILNKLANPWHGTGPYRYSGGGVQADHKFYEELGYMVTNLDRSSMVQDPQGSLLNFAVGVGVGSAQPLPLERVLEELAAQFVGGAK